MDNIDASKLGYGSTQKKRMAVVIFVILSFLIFSFYYNSTVGRLPKCNSDEVMEVLSNKLPAGTLINNPQQYDSNVSNAIRYCRVTLDNEIHNFKIMWYSENKDRYIVSFL
ncbi:MULTISPECIES: hypothetical protein [Providencia]|uniref:hypothetical protein n=1 Tax=Providencia TaxID=586 RepID=UPI000685149D|nr:MULTISPECIES: hypothetical protein [Providencia]MTC21310.1 hypothetical protein [Providencia sp. wls1938]MTC22155.1 hypothetical protein [Providencia sp. wls1938]MTC23712.1 hypothetical protein [Providencia sp. wls1938]MTC24593.1 hypothetical protein [Providencia sp. wls1938]MTC38464.1 hypothetical protein [Providencia alcalifaciens]